MFGSKVVEAKVRLESGFDGTYIHEYFAHAKIKKENDNFYAYVKANEDSIIYWCVQYGDVVELIEPRATRDKIMKELQNTLKKYMENK